MTAQPAHWTTADDVELDAIADAIDQLKHDWHLGDVLAILVEAQRIADELRAQPRCAECDGPCPDPVRDPAAVAWLRDGAPTFCTVACMAARDQREQNADGGAA